MKNGDSILVFNGEKWITVLYVKQVGNKVYYRVMNGYGATKHTTVERVRDIYEGKGELPKVSKKNEGKLKWMN